MIRAKVVNTVGQHVKVNVYSGRDKDSLKLAGTLVFDKDEWAQSDEIAFLAAGFFEEEE